MFFSKLLRASHDWERRKYVLNMVRDWNLNTGDHARAIEDVFPHIRDVDRTSGHTAELTKEMCKQIYTCAPNNKNYWEVRFHLIELLNYFEFIAIAYFQNVADREIVTSSFKGPMLKWHDILKNFVDVVHTCEGYEPWKPYTDVISEWRSVVPAHRKPTA